MRRRNVASAAVAAAVYLVAAAALPARGAQGAAPGGALPIPPVIEGETIDLVAGEGRLRLPFGTSETIGYNGDYLGPTIRVRDGDDVDIFVRNTLREETTVHWHGLHVPAEFDGGPRQVIAAGETWNPRFTIDQAAATLWYHPHLLGRTAEQVYRGLAGLFIIDDAYADSLAIPRDYGVNDIPLVLQDRRIDRDGTFSYNPRRPDVMHGYIGSAVLANGAFEPALWIDRGTYRFRILNGSNSSMYRLSFSDGRRFTVIAGDGGFLPESVEMDALVMVPGERFEILVDFEEPAEVSLIVEIDGGDTFEAVSIDVGREAGEFFTHPVKFEARLVSLPGAATAGDSSANPDPAVPRRTFRMEAIGMGGLAINGQVMNMNRLDFTVTGGRTEIWTIESVNMGMMRLPHSFHVHDVQFRVLSVNGEPPHPVYRGPKDTVPVMPGQRVEIALRFEDYDGIYMYHCHFLEHEDAGMMGQFMVEQPVATM